MTTKHPTTSRRSALGFSAAAVFAGLTAPAIAGTTLTAGAQEPVDPLLELYRQYRALEAALDLVDARHTVLRAAMVERYGEYVSAVELWRRDPDYPEMDRTGDEATRITDEELVPAIDSIIDTPARSLAGLLVKAQVALDQFPSNDAGIQYHEIAAFAALEDAVQLLAEAGA
jgi:hypothetical protein